MNKQKVGLLPKIIMTIGMFIIFGLGILYYVEVSTGDGNVSFFTKHFMVPIILSIIGAIAMFLPTVSAKTLSGDDKGDKMMYGVGLLLFLCALISLLTSFI